MTETIVLRGHPGVGPDVDAEAWLDWYEYDDQGEAEAEWRHLLKVEPQHRMRLVKVETAYAESRAG